MQVINKMRWLRSASISVTLAVLFGGLVAQSVRAVSSNPTPVCVGASCSVTFESTGDYYLWTPPAGAKNISFDLMGAQGGRSGGLGGRVTGALTTTPTSLYIYVGGAGNQGSGAAGGFNGGGNAGGGRGDEGSGGGATDIRTTTSMNDRVAVAGGGGGSGGFSGGVGGSAGGLNASAGTSGQGQGGSGATQSSGGNGGYPNGGSWGTSGDYGVGGSGGSSSVSGGGGGGGGFYGGGGGGADIDTCCSNAGGGGGGSSWSHSVQTTSVSHTAAYRSGAGLAILTYAMPPSATTFAAASNLTNASSIIYNLVFNESVTGLNNTDFLTTSSTATCTGIAVTGSGTTYSVAVQGCSVGTVKLTLVANSVSGVLAGPATDKIASDVVIERTAPTVSVTPPTTPTLATTLQYAISFSESITGLAAEDFTVTGTSCQVGVVAGTAASYTVTVINCSDTALAKLNLNVNSVTDLAGNMGPAAAPVIGSVQIDRLAPVGTWASAAATSYVSPSFEIDFAESVNGLVASDFLMIGAATSCVISVTEVQAGLKFNIATSGCSDGSVQVLMNANSYTDSLGNTGPTIVSASAVTTKIAQPAPTPTPTPTPTPVPTVSAAPVVVQQPLPPAPPEPEQSQSDVGQLPSAISEPKEIPAGTELVAAQPVRKTYAFTPQVVVVEEPVAENPHGYDLDEPQITVRNPTDPKPIGRQVDWRIAATIGLGAISVTLALIGITKGARLARTRRLVKKYA